jgi:predicted ATPase
VRDSTRRYVITGGPGSGKSTLIQALSERGFATTVEAGRAIIQDQQEIGGDALPWHDPQAFAQLMLSWEMRSYRSAAATKGPVFFDRGIPDVVGYLRLMSLPVPPSMDHAARIFRYDRRVFIAPPWTEIFAQDHERRQTFEEAVRTYESMVQTYSSYEYELVTLPLTSVSARAEFILNRVNADSA